MKSETPASNTSKDKKLPNVKPYLFFDLDGVIADFEKAIKTHKNAEVITRADQYKLITGAYKQLDLMDENIPKYLELLSEKFDIYIATKIPHDNPFSAYEKLEWVKEKIPMLTQKVIITPNKGCLGDFTSYLVDDRPHKAKCDEFQGKFIFFSNECQNKAKNHYKTNDWSQLVQFLLNDII